TAAKVSDWLGDLNAAVDGGDMQKSKLSRVLGAAIQKEAENWEKRWCKAAFSLMDLPGRRLAAAEAALQRLVQFCEETFATRDAELQVQTQRLKEGRQQLAEAKHNCITGQGG